MKNIMVYFVDSNLHIFYQHKLFTEELKGIIIHGLIVDKVHFLEQFNKILKKHKIKSRLFGDEITVVKNVFYSTSDLFFLEQIFLDLGFTKVHYFDIREVLPDDDATYIEVNQDYIVFYFEEGLSFSLKYFHDLPKLFSILESYLKSTVVFFGTNHNIPKFLYAKKESYYIDDYESYLIDSLLKVKECDV